MRGIRGCVGVWALRASVPFSACVCLTQDAGTPAAAGRAKASPVDPYEAAGDGNAFAGLIHRQFPLQIDAVCKDPEKQPETHMAIVIVESLEAMTLEEGFFNGVVQQMGPSAEKHQPGVIVCCSRQATGNRAITVGQGLESLLTREEAAKLGTEMRPMFRKGDHRAALFYGAKRIRDEVMEKVR